MAFISKERKAKYILSAEDRSKLVLKKAQANFNKLGGAVTKLKGLMLGLAAATAFTSVIRATARQEAALAQLEQRLKTTSGVVGRTKDEIVDFAAELQRLTNFGDEAILEMQGVLLTFTNIRGEVFEDTTKTILDMSVALDQDLKSSVIQLGKALNSPIIGLTALGRVGVNFTTEQKELIKTLVQTGEVAKAQRVILNELAIEFGGSATAAADTFGGSLQQLGNAFGDLFEQKGGLEDSKKSIQELTKTLSDPSVQEGFDTIVVGMTKLVSLAADAASAIGTLTSAVSFLFDMVAAEGDNDTKITRAKAAIEEFTRYRLLLNKKIKEATDAQDDKAFSVWTKRLSILDEKINRLRVLAGIKDEAPGKDVDPDNPLGAAFGVDTGLKKGSASAKLYLGDITQATKSALAELTRLREQDLVSAEEHIRARLSLEQNVLDEEIRRRREALSELTDSAKIRSQEQAIARLQERRVELERQGNHKVLMERKKLQEEIETLHINMQDRLLQAQGRSAEAEMNELAREFTETVEKLLSTGDTAGIELARRLFNVEASAISLEEIERKSNEVLSRMSEKERSIDIEREAGLITEKQARERIIALHQETAAELESMIPMLEKVADTLGPAAVAKVEAFKNSIVELQTVTNEAANEINQSLEANLSTAIDGFINKTKTAKEVFNDFASSVVNDISRMLSKQVSASIMSNMNGGETGGGFNIGEWFAEIFQFHDGGIIGKGGKRRLINPMVFAGAPQYHTGGIGGLGQDEVPGIFKRGEEVLTEQDPRHRNNGGLGNNFTFVLPNVRDKDDFKKSVMQHAQEAGRMLDQRNRN